LAGTDDSGVGQPDGNAGEPTAAHDATVKSKRWPAKLDDWIADQFKMYGALRKCKGRHWRSAFNEFVITLLFALLPIWVPFIALPMFKAASFDPGPVLHDQIKNGELYIIAAALLAPIYYFTFPQSRSALTSSIRPFPSQQLLILIFIGTVCLAVLAIAATKVQTTPAGIPPRMIDISVGLFVSCSIIFFLTLAVRNSMPETAEASYDEESRREQMSIPPPKPLDLSGGPVNPDDLVASAIKSHSVKARGTK
jgi:hypothetical protein